MIDYTVLSDVVTALVAVYGAILATYTAVARWREKRVRIHVEVSLGFTVDQLAGSSEPMVFLSASNPGSKAITLSPWGLALPNRKLLSFHNPLGSDVQFPHELAPETSCRAWVEAKEIARAMKTEGYSDKTKVVGFYRDQVGRTYKSKPFEFDVEDWPK